MADGEVDPELAAAGPKKRTFRKFSYRGVDLDALLDMSSEDLVQLFPARARRRFSRGLKRKPMALVKKLRKAVSDCSIETFVCSWIVNYVVKLIRFCRSDCSKLHSFFRECNFEFVAQLNDLKSNAPAGEKPEPVRTHLRNMIIMPEMIGSLVGIYNGKMFNQVEIKPEMIGHYLAEFSLSYKPVKHGRPGIGATHSSRFIPLK
ncbi:hypothetical protein ACQ4PT_004590 [Festuca glaucescens]